MKELSPTQFPAALPLFAGMHTILPAAILEGVNPGRVFVDCVDAPATALLWTPCGYFFLAGQTGDSAAQQAVAQTLHEVLVPASTALGENGFILYPREDAWDAIVPALLQDRQHYRIFRRTFQLDPARFAASGDWRARIPAGLTLRRIDRELLAHESNGLAAEIHPFWENADHFLEHGLGFCLLDGGVALSQCTAAFASSAGMEINISTAEGQRRKGYAALVASAFIEACLEQGQRPNWECFWDNQPSVRLAEKLGYTMLRDVPVYYWEG